MDLPVEIGGVAGAQIAPPGDDRNDRIEDAPLRLFTRQRQRVAFLLTPADIGGLLGRRDLIPVIGGPVRVAEVAADAAVTLQVSSTSSTIRWAIASSTTSSG